MESTLKGIAGVKRATRHKDRNYDMAILVEFNDPADIQRLITQVIPMVAGVKGVERMETPAPTLLKQLAG